MGACVGVRRDVLTTFRRMTALFFVGYGSDRVWFGNLMSFYISFDLDYTEASVRRHIALLRFRIDLCVATRSQQALVVANLRGLVYPSFGAFPFRKFCFRF